MLTGGADFGGGVWDLLARGRRGAAQRDLIVHTIGPIWEANHVWLIVAVVLLFTAFPVAFATMGTVLHIPLTMMLVGIVLRGSAFVFRSYGAETSAAQRRWGRLFAVASTITPLLLGIIVGALASGAVGRAEEQLARPAGVASFAEVFIAPWCAPFPVAIGVLTLASFAFLAAVYLTVEARDPLLRAEFRRRAAGAAAAVFVAAFGAIGIAHVYAPHIAAHLVETRGAFVLQGATAIAAVTALWALWRGRWRLSRIAAAAQVSLILWGWMAAQYPFVIPGAHTIREAAAPQATLALVAGALGVGGALLVPSLFYLFRTFGAARDGEGG